MINAVIIKCIEHHLGHRVAIIHYVQFLFSFFLFSSFLFLWFTVLLFVHI